MCSNSKTRAEVIQTLDKGIDGLFAGAVGSSIAIANSKKEWIGSTMHFSFMSRMGFIALPINGTIYADDSNAILYCGTAGAGKEFYWRGPGCREY